MDNNHDLPATGFLRLSSVLAPRGPEALNGLC
jgi:hypothetical protein